MTISPSDGPACACCGVVAHPTCYTDQDGKSFCSVRCYEAWCENIIDYLDAAKAGRHYFEKPDWRKDMDRATPGYYGALPDPWYKDRDYPITRAYRAAGLSKPGALK